MKKIVEIMKCDDCSRENVRVRQCRSCGKDVCSACTLPDPPSLSYPLLAWCQECWDSGDLQEDEAYRYAMQYYLEHRDADRLVVQGEVAKMNAWDRLDEWAKGYFTTSSEGTPPSGSTP